MDLRGKKAVVTGGGNGNRVCHMQETPHERLRCYILGT